VLVGEAAALERVEVSVGLPVLVGKARLRVAVPVPVLVKEIPRDLVIVPELVEVNDCGCPKASKDNKMTRILILLI
jgi:hypothetical protein